MLYFLSKITTPTTFQEKIYFNVPKISLSLELRLLYEKDHESKSSFSRLVILADLTDLEVDFHSLLL